MGAANRDPRSSTTPTGSTSPGPTERDHLSLAFGAALLPRRRARPAGGRRRLHHAGHAASPRRGCSTDEHRPTAAARCCGRSRRCPPTSARDDDGYRLGDQPRCPPGTAALRASAPRRRSPTPSSTSAADRFAAGLRRAPAAARATGCSPLLPNGVETFELLLGCARAGLVAGAGELAAAADELAAVAADAGAAARRGRQVARRDLLSATSVDGGAPPARTAGGPQYDAWLADARTAPPDGPGTRARRRRAAGLHVGHQRAARRACCSPTGNLAAKVPRRAPALGPRTRQRSACSPRRCSTSAGSAGASPACTPAPRRSSPATRARPTLLAHLADDAGDPHLPRADDDRAALRRGAGERRRFPALRSRSSTAPRRSAPQTQARGAATRSVPVLHQVYGLIETTGASPSWTPDRSDPADPPLAASAGRPYPWVELEIRDPAPARAARRRQFGEVWTRSAQNSPGYSGRPEATARAADARRLAAHRRRRPPRRGRLPVPHRPGQGPDHHRRRERVPGRGRGGAAQPPGRRRRRRRRRCPDRRWGEVVAAVVVPRAGWRLDPDDVIAFTRRPARRLQAAPRASGSSTSCRATPTGKVLPAGARGDLTRRRPA